MVRTTKIEKHVLNFNSVTISLIKMMHICKECLYLKILLLLEIVKYEIFKC